MTQTSRHLSDIVERHNRTCGAQVAFVDVVSYSKRRTLNKITVVDALTEDLQAAIDAVAKTHLSYCQDNSLNFKTDVIRIPTGDGAAVVFSFDGLAAAHLDFAMELLHLAAIRRAKSACDRFDGSGWCNCHPYYNLRIGLSEGKVVVFNDVNGNFNVAGGTINLPSRVMGLADKNQIMLTSSAYEQVIDMTAGPTFLNRFVEFGDVEIKHKETISVHQYVGRGEDFLNVVPPEDLLLRQRVRASFKTMRTAGFPMPDLDAMGGLDKSKMGAMIEQLAEAAAQMQQTMSDTVARPSGDPRRLPRHGSTDPEAK